MSSRMCFTLKTHLLKWKSEILELILAKKIHRSTFQASPLLHILKVLNPQRKERSPFYFSLVDISPLNLFECIHRKKDDNAGERARPSHVCLSSYTLCAWLTANHDTDIQNIQTIWYNNKIRSFIVNRSTIYRQEKTKTLLFSTPPFTSLKRIRYHLVSSHFWLSILSRKQIAFKLTQLKIWYTR